MVTFNPFTAPPPEEVPLKDAPLIRVIAQVRFPPILSIEKRDFVGAFQESIRDNYPILQPEQTKGFAFDDQGVVPIIPQLTWRFVDVVDNWNWRVSLAPSFVALETTAYLSRYDFLKRLQSVLIALNENFKPASIDRFGLRYIDRVVGQNLQDISLLVKPQIAGMISTDFREYIYQTINESLLISPDSGEQIVARWGSLPSGVTFDPSAIAPIAEPSWILDLDMSLSKNRGFNIESLILEGQNFSERIYTFFRWAVNNDFLRRFGGEL
ncbi:MULTISPECIES: TIGR04255 family protein [Pseudanabaena]|uniref:TIGR04255 family protein n=1 Tax=Pseudanabaena TaxID=1152 RepID=UPI002479C5F3|nr:MULTISPECIES: TIGR04255 family protein [Pseudanabaena]MEA5488516.1 TIGR04255 family protein [Pseudanabaena sp. CCNP1317]WGS71916.1 TIGR04255 family protein [Pseudanabaena galeata CCNP1313]